MPKKKAYVEQYYSHSEDEMQELLSRAKKGDTAAQEELLNTFSNFLQKYETLLYHGRYSLHDYDVRCFVSLFIKDKLVRSAVKRNKVSNDTIKSVNEVMRGIFYMIQRYADPEDVEQTVRMSFFHCFSGETEFITSDGVKTLKETVGTMQRVLSLPLKEATNIERFAHTEYGGKWVDAEIKSFGEQYLYEVIVARNGVVKSIFATAEHRWLVNPVCNNATVRQSKQIVRTVDLLPKQRLAALYPTNLIKAGVATTRPSSVGVAHGFVYGDGTLVTGGGSTVTLWGDKDLALLPYFPLSPQKERVTPLGIKGIAIRDLPNYFKEKPSLNESLSYLYGWLAGYFAADGCVGSTGSPSLSSACREDLEFVQSLCSRLGIATRDIATAYRKGYGNELTPLYKLSFVANSLTEDFFLNAKHRNRFISRSMQNDSVGWRVVEVKATDRYEEVFCATVPLQENFTLSGNINVMNCVSVYERKGKVPFSGFLYSYYYYVLKKQVDALLINQLGRKTFALISDEDMLEDSGSDEQPTQGFTAPPTLGADEFIFSDEIDEDWVSGKTAYGAFAILTVQERQLIKWRYIDGIRSNDIAEKITEHPNTVREHYHRIRGRISEYLLNEQQNQDA